MATRSAGSRKDGGEPLWMGSLRADDVASYDERIIEIEHEIDELEFEDVKQHVLHHHILPLTPPSSPPASGRLRSSSSASTSFTKMNDLTAAITAIVLQALPLLSKLVRLLAVWRVRLLVLKKIPAFLESLLAAEIAIQSAWKAVCPAGIDDGSKYTTNGATGPVLKQEEFAIMKTVVESKVSEAARTTDFLLDTLDGWEDTIPEEWIERIDAAEREYGEWVALCERKIRESDWKRVTIKRPTLAPPLQILEKTATGHTHTGKAAAGASMLPKPIHARKKRSADTRSAKPDNDAATTTGATYPPTMPHTPPRALSVQSSLESLRSEPELPSFTKVKPFDDANDEDMDSTTASIIHIPSDERLPSQLGLAGEDRASIIFADDLPDDSFDMADPEDPEELRKDASPSSSPPDFRATVIRSPIAFNDMPTVAEIPDEDGSTRPKTPFESSFVFGGVTKDDMDISHDVPPYLDSPGSSESPVSMSSRRTSVTSEDDQLQQQIIEILESIPAKIHLSSQPSPTFSHLNPPDFKVPRKGKVNSENTRSLSSMSSRSMTPSFLLAPAYSRNPRPRHQRGNQEIKLYHLSRSTGEAPIKLFIRPVGENGERVMVRVGGGWADLTEYLKEYASHHSRRSKTGAPSQIEIRDVPLSSSFSGSINNRVGSSPPSRPNSALGSPATINSLNIRKSRRSTTSSISTTAGSSDGSTGIIGASSNDNNSSTSTSTSTSTSNNNNNNNKIPRTPLASMTRPSSATPPSEGLVQSRSSSRMSWTEEDSTLGMSGPRAKNIEMSEESKAWVESVKERVRIASGELRSSEHLEGKFGEIGRVGGTKRVFRKSLANKNAGDRS